MRWPTNTDVGYLRQRQDNYSRVYLGVQKGKERTDAPTPLMVGMHYQLTATDTYTATNHVLTFAAGFLTGTDIKVGMTLSVGTLTDPTLYGAARIIQVGTNTIVLEENNISALGHLTTGEYIWVDGVYRLYRILPYMHVKENGAGGVYYEEGNSTGTGAGIPGMGIVHPNSDEYDYRPVALMGSPRFAWAGENVDFFGWRSHGRAGNTITHWTWDFDGGTCAGPGLGYPGSPSSPIHVSWATAGEYIASLKVRDNSGNINPDAYGIRYDEHTAVRPVLVYDRPGQGSNTPYTEFEVNSLTGRYGQGWEARITVFGTADKSEFPDNALIILYAEDWYNGQRRSMGGWYGQEEILFCGYIRAGSVVVDSEKSTVTFEAQTIDQWMREIDVWPVNFIDPGVPPTAWHEFNNMTVEDCLWHLASLHSTLKNVADCFFASDVGVEKLLGCVDLTEASLYDQMSNQLGSCFFGQVTASRQGSVHLFKHKNMMDLIERTWFGPPIYEFTKQDWHSEPSIGEERMRNSVAQVDFVGFVYDTNRQPQDCFSLAPAHQTHFGGIEKVTGILLTGTAVGPGTPAQNENNTLAGLYLAWKNTRFPQISLPVLNNRFLEPATLDYFAATLAASDTIRGYNWPRKEFLCTGVSYNIDNEKGIITADVEGEASTWGPDGVAGDYPRGLPLGPPGSNPGEFWGEFPTGSPPPWAETSPAGCAYFVLRDKGHVIRVTGASSVEPSQAIYEDLGCVDAGGLYWIALDQFDPSNRAMVCGPNGVWSTRNLATTSPTWTLEVSPTGGRDFVNVRSSTVVDRLWMAVECSTATRAYVHWTSDDGATWSSQIIGTAAQHEVREHAAYLEMSSHDAAKAWVVFYRSDGNPWSARTTDTWASHVMSVGPTGCINSPASTGQSYPPAHHRYADNTADLVCCWGGQDRSGAPTYRTNIWYGLNELGGATTACSTICGWTQTYWWAVREVGNWPGNVGDWWALTYCEIGVGYATSNDGINWSVVQWWTRDLRVATTERMRHACDYRANRNYRFAVEDGDGVTRGGLHVSRDAGVTWQRQVGNWTAVCAANSWTGHEPHPACVTHT